METNIDPTIGKNGAWAEGIGRANHILQLVLGRSGAGTRAVWKLMQDQRGRPILALTLSDDTGSVNAVFVPEELENSEKMWHRLRRLWDDLLQVRSHKLLEGLLQE